MLFGLLTVVKNKNLLKYEVWHWSDCKRKKKCKKENWNIYEEPQKFSIVEKWKGKVMNNFQPKSVEYLYVFLGC